MENTAEAAVIPSNQNDQDTNMSTVDCTGPCNSSDTNNLVNNGFSAIEPADSSHIRKNLRPKKLPVYSDHGEDSLCLNNSSVETTSTTSGLDVENEVPTSCDIDRDPQAIDLENERRKSLRPRRKVKRDEAFQDDSELDQLLSDETTLTAYGPAQYWNTGAGDYLTEDWISVEKILAHRVLAKRKLTKFVTEAVKSYPDAQRKVVQLEYLVKFRDQSYWHCAWMSGAILLALHPNMVRNYLRVTKVDLTSSEDTVQNEESVDETASCLDRPTCRLESDAVSGPVAQSSVSSGIGPKIDKGSMTSSLTVEHTSEEEDDEEDDLEKCSSDSKENVAKWISKKAEELGSRRRYLLRWGVDRYSLVPERIVALGDPVTVSFGGTGGGDNTSALREPIHNRLKSVEYREVLIKWFNVPLSQSTWETVEFDLDMLTIVAAFQKGPSKTLLRDSSGRKLLPMVIRRHLIQLIHNYCVRLAGMLCDAYGCHYTIDKRPPAKFGDWKSKWLNGQPSYLSPEHGATLHPYQLEGVRWLWHAYHNHVNAILADEMGLGKTVQVIALLYSLWKERNDYGPFLIVAPLSTLFNWEHEFEVWAPDFHVLVYTGDRSVRVVMQEHEFRIANSDGVAAFHVMITSHELACIERPCLQGFDWSALIVDEAHRLRNKQSRLFRETSQYKAGFKMLLTGTPLQNNLEELFHLLYFVEPKSLSDFKSLTGQWAEMPKEERIASLHNQLKNHLLRRLKVDVIQDLPKKSEISVIVDMSVLQRKLYKLVITKNYEELRCGSLMNSLVHLQKVCDHPYLLPVGDAIAPRESSNDGITRYEPSALIQVSGKMVVLIQMLRRLREEGHRVLIYSRMTTMLDILEEALSNEGYAYERIDGRVKGPLRQIIIDRFNTRNSETFIFLLSTRAGGEGINLATADTVVLYDSDWNPQCDLQALSRAHRIGQSRHVVVYRFVTRHSMEERIQLVARRKLALTDLVVNQSQQRKQQKLLDSQTPQATEQGKLEEVSAMESVEVQPTAPSSDTTQEPQSDVLASVTKPHVGHVSNRFSRTEMDDMLRCGLEALFSVDDLLDENDLHKAARNLDESQQIVYDAAAIERLMDRSRLEDSVEHQKSAADEYLGTFSVAQFDLSAPFSSSSVLKPDAVVEGPASIPIKNEDLGSAANETLGYAAFWDRLLRERYNRLCNSDGKVSEIPKRTTKASWRLQQQNDDEFHSNSDLEFTPNADSQYPDDSLTTPSDHFYGRPRVKNVKADHDDTGVSFQRRKRKVQPNRRYIQPDMLLPKGQSRGRKSNAVDPNRTSCSADPLVISDEDDDDDSNDAAPDSQANSEEDPPYIPSGDDSDDAVTQSSCVPSWRRNTRRSSHKTSNVSQFDEVEGAVPIPTATSAFGNVCDDDHVTAFWHPSPAVCAKWREAVNWIGPKITWKNGFMFIYGFGPDDRQQFANAVMRYGLPPPGIIPPQDWLPPNLYSKSSIHLYAYTSLFMGHLYGDPKALDDSVPTWTDGLPKEKLSASSVLARIAIMALIRNKVLQFEDVNGVHSRTFEAVSTRFKFSIHEGGLTMLRSVWQDEWQRINTMVESVMPHPNTWNVASRKRDQAMYYLQHTWHSRHDYWLLAAIHIHGYLRWTDMLSDTRFHLLTTGLSGILTNSKTEETTAKDANIQNSNVAESQAFLINRLRLLEHALLVEQALYEVARAALTSNGERKFPPLNRVQNLAVCLSNKLAAAGPRKRIALPRDPVAREATRVAVTNLQELLEDLYADLPALPASVVCAEPEYVPSHPTLTVIPELTVANELTSTEKELASSNQTYTPSSVSPKDSCCDSPSAKPAMSESGPPETPVESATTVVTVKPSPVSPLPKGVIEISDSED